MNRKACVVAIFIGCTCLLSLSTYAKKQSAEAKRKGEQKLEWMLSKTQEDPIIQTKTSSFKAYINNGPRPYSVVVTFTALDPSNNCEVCQNLHKEMVEIAKRYADARENEPHKVFFAEVDYSNNMEIFNELDMKSAPMVILIPSTESSKSHSVGTLFTRYKRTWQYTLHKGIKGSDIIEWVVKMTSVDVSENFTLTTRDIILSGVALIAFCLIVFYFGSYIHEKLKNVWLFIIIALFVYLFNISGGMFNIIRETQWANQDYNGKIKGYIHPQARMQFAAEGFMMGAAYFGCSICLLTLIYSQRRPKNGRRGLSMLLDYCPSVLVVFTFFYVYYNILMVYTQKNKSYNLGNVGFFG